MISRANYVNIQVVQTSARCDVTNAFPTREAPKQTRERVELTLRRCRRRHRRRRRRCRCWRQIIVRQKIRSQSAGRMTLPSSKYQNSDCIYPNTAALLSFHIISLAAYSCLCLSVVVCFMSTAAAAWQSIRSTTNTTIINIIDYIFKYSTLVFYLL